MIKKRIVKCEWWNVLEYRDNHGDWNIIEVLATYNSREEANKDRNRFYDRLDGTNYTLATVYREELLNEEIIE